MSDEVFVAVVTIVGWVISVCFHEYSHALVAYIGGDKSVKARGYLRFNPFAYTDIRLSIILPTVILMLGGIGLPGASVQIRPDQLRNPHWASLVAAAGPAATFAFAILLVLLIKSVALPYLLVLAFSWLVNLEILVWLLNLLPIPGLDGFGILEPFLPKALKKKLKPYYKHGFTFLIVMMWFVPGPNRFLWLVSAFIVHSMGVSLIKVERGESLYRDGAMPVAVVCIVVAGIAYYLNKQRDWHAKGEQFLVAGKFQECLDLMDAVLAKKEDAKAYRLRALCLAGLGEMAIKAKAPPRNAEQKQVDSRSEDSALGGKEVQVQASAAGKSEIDYKKESFASIDKCLSLEGELFENWLSRGIICDVLGEPEEALKAYEKTLELSKSCERAFTRKCEILYSQKRFDALLADCQTQLAIDEDNGEALFFKGAALGGLGKLPEALKCFEDCILKGVRSEQSVQNRKMLNEMIKEQNNK